MREIASQIESHGARKNGSARNALRLAASIYCWSALTGITATCYTSGRIAELRDGAVAWERWLNRWARAVIRCGGHVCRVDGLQHVAGGAVLAANHQSIFDVAVLAACVPMPMYFVARQEVLRVPMIGGVLERGEHLIVRRGAGAENELILSEAVRRVKQGARVVFFPEGSRSTDGSVRRFRNGAFVVAQRAGRPLVPVALEGTRHAVRKGSAAIIPARVRVEFLEPLTIGPGEPTDDLRREVRRIIASRVDDLVAGTGSRI